MKRIGLSNAPSPPIANRAPTINRPKLSVNSQVPSNKHRPTTPSGRREYTDFPNVYLDKRAVSPETLNDARRIIDEVVTSNLGKYAQNYARFITTGKETTIQPITQHHDAHVLAIPGRGERENGITITDADADKAQRDAEMRFNHRGELIVGPGSDALLRFNPRSTPEIRKNQNGQQYVEFTSSTEGTKHQFTHELTHALRANHGHQLPSENEEEKLAKGTFPYHNHPMTDNAYRRETGAPYLRTNEENLQAPTVVPPGTSELYTDDPYDKIY